MGSVTQEAQLLRDILRVAVIGAGISGVASAAHLLRYGLDVTVFERSSIAGGVWHYDPRTAREPPYPNERPPVPANANLEPPSGTLVVVGNGTTPAEEASFDEVSIAHAPPGPCYVGLRNNVPTSLMRSTLLDWPEGSQDFVSQDHLERYIQRLAKHTGAQEKTLRTLVRLPGTPSAGENGNENENENDNDYKFVDRTWQFDAVVVASGHYHEPRVPDIPGLQDLKRRFPDRVMHSKRYRTPEIFRDKNVFIVGAGVSSLDIARESEATAKHIYQSSRGGKFDLPLPCCPRARNEWRGSTASSRTRVLADNTRLRNIHHVVLGTGYLSSYPFLAGPPHLQAPDIPLDQAGHQTIITADGCVTHNLHKDIFYLPDPTLAFVGVPYHISTFSLFDFQAEVVARVFAGRATLPTEAAMRREYDGRRAKMTTKTENSSKEFHSLWGRETEYMDELLGWVNGDAALLGYEGMKGVDDRWRSRREEFAKKMKEIRRWPPVAGADGDGGRMLKTTVARMTAWWGKTADVVRASVGIASA
ncbi:hypothetical protein PG988_003901 [Apiospora saccharicola]